LALAGLLGTTPPLSAAGSDDAVSYRIDAIHSGAQPNDQLALPLHRRWAVDFGGPSYWFNDAGKVSYPLVADGRVFVTTVHPGYGSDLFALDAATGRILWGPRAVGGTYNFSATAYDLGRVFVVNYDGLVRGFDAATGQLAWATKLNQYAFDSPPTAAGGVVYVAGAGSGGTLYAVSEATGAVLWAHAVMNGMGSAPTVSANAVYVTYSCEQDDAFDRVSGTRLWHHSTSCAGGGGYTSALSAGRLYDLDTDPEAKALPNQNVFDAQTGLVVGSFSANFEPAFDGLRAFFLFRNQLTATLLGTPIAEWTRPLPDGIQVMSAPVADGRDVFLADTTGRLYGFDEYTGAPTWSASTPVVQANSCGSCPLVGIAIAEHELLVPFGSQLVAFS
jgi:outer membrane protein assembly factor BamB